VTLKTNVGFIYLDGDFDGSSTGDRLNTVDLNHGGTIEAKTNLTLKASTGNAGSDHVLVENQFTLRAGSASLTIMDDLGYPGGWLDMLALVNGGPQETWRGMASAAQPILSCGEVMRTRPRTAPIS